MNFLGQIMLDDGVLAGVFDNGESFTIDRQQPGYKQLLQCFKDKDCDEFYKILNDGLDLEKCIKEHCDTSGITVSDGNVYYNGVELDNTIVDCIKKMIEQEWDFQPMVYFLSNLMNNLSNRSVTQLFSFLEKMGLAVTEDGCFLAYKTVRDNYLDKFSGKIDNSPGAINEMPRNMVDDDPASACSRGFHVGALGYAGPDGWYNSSDDNIVICKVNPMDVVCIPYDHDCQKLRCCKYTVVADFQGELKSACYTGKVNDDYSEKVIPDKIVLEKIDSSSDMLVGQAYEFDYVCQHRYGIILEHRTDGTIFIEMIRPDIHSYKSDAFARSIVVNIKEYKPHCVLNEADYDDCDDDDDEEDYEAEMYGDDE